MTRKRARSQIRNEGDWAKQTLRSPKTTAGMGGSAGGVKLPDALFSDGAWAGGGWWL